ncbi:hypothetical protein D3C72_1391700 [compost metagenome]
MNVSEEVYFLPYTFVADVANFAIMGSGSTLRISAVSRLNPGISKLLDPKVSHSAISVSAYKSIRFPGDPWA